MINNMKNLIKTASKGNYIIPGFNVFGYEDAAAVVRAAEELGKPTMLMINKLATEHMPVEYWGKLLRSLAQDAQVPVGIHLDHCENFNTVIRAINSGFSSVMYDGSQLPISENIKRTNEIVKIAEVFDVSVEGEIGSVPYADIPGKVKSAMTDINEAIEYSEETGIDWVAVSVGQVHRLRNVKSKIDFQVLEELQRKVSKPLVIHGGSGIEEKDLVRMADYNIGKINVGTSLRVAFGETLRQQVIENPDEFDRIKLFYEPSKAVIKVTKDIYKVLYENGRQQN